MTDKQLSEEFTVDQLIKGLIEFIGHWHSLAMSRGVMIKELQQKLLDAKESDRRPEHHSYTFHTYNSADAAFIHSYLNRNREAHSDAQG
ncbi:hypothetical protein [Pseudomonas silesiensis]